MFSVAKVEPALFGRIEKSTVNFLNNKHKELDFDKFYLCGPRNDQYFRCFKGTQRQNTIELFATSTKENAIENH
jgi:ring-1,2-phenylacetyl-CoA epoxidase subunit PaaE